MVVQFRIWGALSVVNETILDVGWAAGSDVYKGSIQNKSLPFCRKVQKGEGRDHHKKLNSPKFKKMKTILI